jgi:hypothetical protein
MGWIVRGSNPGEGEIFGTRPDRSWVSPSLLYNGYRVSFTGVKRSGRGVDHPPLSSAEVKERIQLNGLFEGELSTDVNTCLKDYDLYCFSMHEKKKQEQVTE